MATIPIQLTTSIAVSAISMTNVLRSDTNLAPSGISLPIALSNTSGNTWAGSFTDTSPPYSYAATATLTTSGSTSAPFAFAIYAGGSAPTEPLPPLPSTPTIIADGQPTDDTLNAVLNYPFAILRSYLGLNGTGWTQLNFTVKAASTDTDSQAIIAVQVSEPPEDSDGMTRLNGAAPASRSDAELSVSTANVYGTTATTIGLQVNSRGMGITALGSYFWEISLYVDSTKQPVVDGGEFQAGPSIRSASGQS